MPYSIKTKDGIVIEDIPDDMPADDPQLKARVAALRAQQTSQQPEGGGIGSYLDNIGRRVASGATFGFADEFAANMAGITGIGGQRGQVDQNLNMERQKDKTFQQSNPVSAFVPEVAGAIVSPLTKLIGGAVGAAKIPRYAKYFAEGVALGGLAGAGNAEEGKRLEGAGIGGTFGGAFGVGVPAAAEIVGSGARAALERIMSRGMTPAGRNLGNALVRDNLTIPMAQQKLADLGPNSVLADLGGNVRGLAEASAQMPGRAASMAEDVLGGRAATQGERIIQSAFKSTGVNSIDELIVQRAAAARPFYDAAFASTKPIYSKKIEQLLANPEVKNGIKHGLSIVRNEADALGTPMRVEDFAIKSFNEAGDPILGGTPTLKLLDAAKRGLDDALEQYRDPVTRRLNLDGRGRSIEQIRKSLVSELDDLTKDQTGQSAYKAAREAWAGPTPLIEALNYIDDVVSKARDSSDITGRLFGSPQAREKLRALFPDDQSFNSFANTIKSEKTFAETKNRVLSNSRTRFRETAQEDMQGGNAADMALSIAQNPSISNLIGQGIQSARRSLRAPPTAVADELAPLLFSSDPMVKEQAFRLLQKRVNAGTILDRFNPASRQALQTGASAGGYSGGLISNQ
jgi:hypothetical protein